MGRNDPPLSPWAFNSSVQKKKVSVQTSPLPVSNANKSSHFYARNDQQIPRSAIPVGATVPPPPPLLLTPCGITSSAAIRAPHPCFRRKKRITGGEKPVRKRRQSRNTRQAHEGGSCPVFPTLPGVVRQNMADFHSQSARLGYGTVISHSPFSDPEPRRRKGEVFPKGSVRCLEKALEETRRRGEGNGVKAQ